MTIQAHPRAYALRDSMTMLRRDARHSVRNPMMTLSGILTPIVMMLIFVGMFGDVMAAQLGSTGSGYVAYLTPGVVLMALGSGVATTAVNLSVDKSEGIIARFRTMPIARMAVLNGTVAGAVARSVVSVACVLAVAVALGFRSSAGPLEWLAALGLVALVAIAFTWLGTAFGLLSSSPATANSMSLIAQFLPLMSSGFVPTERMPEGIRWFAEHQPYTPLIESLRALITGQSIGTRWIGAVLWCLVIWALAHLWARYLFNREQAAPRGATVTQLMSR